MNKLVIFGVGLIGGSVALALKRKLPALQIVGAGRSGESQQTAIDLGVIDAIASDLPAALANADVIMLAAPVAQTANILSLIAPHLTGNSVITDVGSTKCDVISHARAILGNKFSQFVPGHPIAGAEKSGVSAARADLFEGKNVVLTPLELTSPEALQKVEVLWELCEARISKMRGEEHDSIFAAVSHLPHLLAFALVNDLALRPNASQLFGFAASGFRDFTRIAGSSPEMWRDISLANRPALLQELNTYQEELARLHTLLESSDGAGLQALFQRASEARNNWAPGQLTATVASAELQKLGLK